MDWLLRGPQIHSTFSNLGSVKTDGYHVNENCNAALATILDNILSEDKYLRTYRRSISFGQNIKKDIIPLLIHAKEDKTIELIIRILVNLSIPIECLLNVDLISKTDYGRYTIFEINNLLSSTKIAFTELRTSKALVDFLKKNVEQKVKLSEKQCTNVSNCLLLLRNILHIPENLHPNPNYNGSTHSIQNQILWNIFSQSFDKIIIKSMKVVNAKFWGVTMVQLVALLYKDQHVVTLHKLLNNWLESSLSESSEDNESNTTPQGRGGSENSSPMLTLDPTSDSSDNCVGDKSGDNDVGDTEQLAARADAHKEHALTLDSSEHGDDKSAASQPDEQDFITGDDKSSGFETTNDDQVKSNKDTAPSSIAASYNRGGHNKNQKSTVLISETSDCGYGTQVENQESVSTSSNEDDSPTKKPKHQKPQNTKQRPNNKTRISATTSDRKRKKIVKRAKATIINVHGLSHNTPTDDDISNVLKEFTVDFLLKGYNSLVQTLHNEILTNSQLQIDTSHFFWLVTYFLKFATQIELDLEHVSSVLSFEIISYLTSEGVNLCEQFELSLKLDGSDLSPNIRKLHLIVTAIREFVQAIEVYKKMPHLDQDAHQTLKKLQIQMCETEDLRSMLVLLLRHYNPKYHSKQYLQDLIVTNHVLLMFLDNVMKLTDYNCSTKMIDHIRQFATPEIMAQYGLLLGDYLNNGEFVNDCIFTIMHHVGGAAGSLVTLFQPNILKTFIALWKSDFEICDDWSDLIEYVINTFVTKPNTLSNALLFSETDSVTESKMFARTIEAISLRRPKEILEDEPNISINTDANEVTVERWTENEMSALSWTYLQNNAHSDFINIVTKQLKEDGINKTRESVIRELFRQSLITRDFYERELKGKSDGNTTTPTVPQNKETKEEEIAKFCDQLIQDGKMMHLQWVQKVLLEICFTMLQIEKRNSIKTASDGSNSKFLNFEIFRVKSEDLPVVSPVAYHSLIMHQSVPLVPWNCEQAKICKDLKFLQLLNKLGFQMPVDTDKVFIRIPYIWTPDFLFGVAGKICPVDMTNLKFSVSELSNSGKTNTKFGNTVPVSSLVETLPLETMNKFYQIQKQKVATMVNFTPRPCPPFKSEVETKQLDWLEIVKKSQERKIILESITKTNEDIVMQLPAEDHEIIETSESKGTAASAVNKTSETTLCDEQDVSLPSCDITEELAEPQHFSTFETASVASDLTRMYVSDEDEKPEAIDRPVMDTKTSKNKPQQIKKQTSHTKGRSSKKRRREN